MIFEFRVGNIWQQMAALGKESTHGQCRMSSRRRVPATKTLWLIQDGNIRPVSCVLRGHRPGQNQNITTKKFIQKVCLQQNSKYLNLKILNFTKRKFYLASDIFISLDRSDSRASLSHAGPSSWYPQASAPSSSGGVLVAIKAGFEQQKVVAMKSSDIQADLLRLTTS